MNLVKAFLLLLVYLISANLTGQTYSIKVGLVGANTNFVSDNNKGSRKYNLGTLVGAMANFKISDMLSVETGVDFVMKGNRFKLGSINVNNYWQYLDVPVSLKYNIEMSDNLEVFFKGGLYGGVGLCGINISGTEGNRELETIDWGNDASENQLKRLDFGVLYGGGVEVDRFQIGASYNLGLANISTYTENGNKLRNRYIQLSVGFAF